MTNPATRPQFGPWLRATWAGWIVGVPLIALLALAGEAVGIGGSQVLVGAGMGLGVGLMQGRRVGSMIASRGAWVLATTLGLSAPFLAYDLSRLLARELPYSLGYSVAVGGLLVGAWQALLLARRFRRAGVWVVASLVGWSLAAGTASIADRLFQARAVRGIAGLLAYVGVIASGGLVLGLVTGAALGWLLPREEAT